MLQALYGGTPPLAAYPTDQHELIKEQREKMPKPGEELRVVTESDRA